MGGGATNMPVLQCKCKPNVTATLHPLLSIAATDLRSIQNVQQKMQQPRCVESRVNVWAAFL